MKKIVVMMFSLLVLSGLVLAVPVLESSGESMECSDLKSGSKTFTADEEEIGIGLFCPSNSKIMLYECSDDACEDKIEVGESYKTNNVLAQYSGFEIGAMYYYDCFDCKGSSGACPISVNEGEEVRIEWVSSDPDPEVGPQGELTYEYEGPVGEDGVWLTQKGDAGIHYQTAKVFDGEFWDETELCIEVIKVNNAASLDVSSVNITIHEGETVEIGANCTDEDGDETSITYSGWMTSDSKEASYDDEGEYAINIDCNDDSAEGESTTVYVTVLNRNRAPVINWVIAQG